jgi:hypothetical protein
MKQQIATPTIRCQRCVILGIAIYKNKDSALLKDLPTLIKSGDVSNVRMCHTLVL